MSSIIASSEPPAVAPTPATGRGVLSSSVRPERLGQPAGRVDGEHDDACGRPRPPARPSAAAVVVLPTPAGAAAHDDAGAGVGEQGVDVEVGGCSGVGGAAGACHQRTPCSSELVGEHRDAAVLDAARRARAARVTGSPGAATSAVRSSLEGDPLGVVVAPRLSRPRDRRRRSARTPTAARSARTRASTRSASPAGGRRAAPRRRAARGPG